MMVGPRQVGGSGRLVSTGGGKSYETWRRRRWLRKRVRTRLAPVLGVNRAMARDSGEPMSCEVVRSVLKNSQMAGGCRLLMLVIAEHADPSGRAWPSLDLLAEETRLTVRHVRRLLRECEQAGELATIQGGGRRRANHYRVFPNGDGNPDICDRVYTRETRTQAPGYTREKPGHPRPETRTSVSLNPDTRDRGTTKNHKEPPPQSGGGGESAERQAIIEALRAEGVIDLSTADTPGLSLPIVQGGIARRRAAGFSVGWLVRTLRDRSKWSELAPPTRPSVDPRRVERMLRSLEDAQKSDPATDERLLTAAAQRFKRGPPEDWRQDPRWIERLYGLWVAERYGRPAGRR